MMTHYGHTELFLILSSRRVTARGDSCKEAIGEINLIFLPLTVSLYHIPKSLIKTSHIKWILTAVFIRTTNKL